MTGRVEALGELLRRRQDLVRRLQRGMVALYVVLMLGPVVSLLGGGGGRHFASLSHIAEAIFWGLWWPAVILSTMLFGQVWCGLLCPDGMLTETASRHGRQLKPPAWMHRAGLAFALYAAETFICDASDAHRSHWGTLLSVGSLSVVAIGVGLIYGRGKRIWCRYLCPVSSIFSLLARSAMLHFRVDRTQWDVAAKPVPKPVDCPLLLDVRRLIGNEKCNMCARCSGHRGAVALALRSPGSEIEGLSDSDVRPIEAIAICYVLIGLGFGGEIGHGNWRLIAVLALASGTLTALGLAVASFGRISTGLRLTYGLIPLGGFGLLVGALRHSQALLVEYLIDAEGFFRSLSALTLALGVIWSGRLLYRLTDGLDGYRRATAVGVGVFTAIALALFYQFASDIV